MVDRHLARDAALGAGDRRDRRLISSTTHVIARNDDDRSPLVDRGDPQLPVLGRAAQRGFLFRLPALRAGRSRPSMMLPRFFLPYSMKDRSSEVSGARAYPAYHASTSSLFAFLRYSLAASWIQVPWSFLDRLRARSISLLSSSCHLVFAVCL